MYLVAFLLCAIAFSLTPEAENQRLKQTNRALLNALKEMNVGDAGCADTMTQLGATCATAKGWFAPNHCDYDYFMNDGPCKCMCPDGKTEESVGASNGATCSRDAHSSCSSGYCKTIAGNYGRRTYECAAKLSNGARCPSNHNACLSGNCLRNRGRNTCSPQAEVQAVAETSVGGYGEWNCVACLDSPAHEYCTVAQPTGYVDPDRGSPNKWHKFQGKCVLKGRCATTVVSECFDHKRISKGCFVKTDSSRKNLGYKPPYECGQACREDKQCKMFYTNAYTKQCYTSSNNADARGDGGFTQNHALCACGGSHTTCLFSAVLQDIYAVTRTADRDSDPTYSKWDCQACIDSPKHDWCWWNDQGNVQVACAPKVGDWFGIPCTGDMDKILHYCFEKHTFLVRGACFTGSKVGGSKYTRTVRDRDLYYCGDECRKDPSCIMFGWAEDWTCQLHHGDGTAGLQYNTGCFSERSDFEIYEVYRGN